MLLHSERGECAKKPKGRQPPFFDGQFKGGCTLQAMTVLCGLNPSTAKAVHGVIGGKRSPASYEAGEFSFYKQNEICMDTNYGKQIISTY
jgi:hypothetical protein